MYSAILTPRWEASPVVVGLYKFEAEEAVGIANDWYVELGASIVAACLVCVKVLKVEMVGIKVWFLSA
jgi:hypothetical protein